MAELGEDNFPNDFDGLDFDDIDIPALQAPSTSARPLRPSVSNIVSSTLASPVPSTVSHSTEDMDPSFFAAVDALEAHALDKLSRAEGFCSPTSPRGLSVQKEDRSVVDKSSDSPQVELSPMSRKGKRKAEPQEHMDIQAILMAYETELTCPICYDLLVGAHVANPCGHTCCGECGYGWLAQNEYEPTCAVCRSSLSARKPFLPNFAVDNLVRQHLVALAKSGRAEWQERGSKAIEWYKRVESWKKHTDARTSNKKIKVNPRSRRRQSRYYEAEDYSYSPPWLIDDGMDDDEVSVTRVVTRRGRTRH